MWLDAGPTRRRLPSTPRSPTNCHTMTTLSTLGRTSSSTYRHPTWPTRTPENTWTKSSKIQIDTRRAYLQKSQTETPFVYRTRLFENLRMLPHAPGVQMANIPEDGVKVDDGAAMDEADPDKRLPKEVNFTGCFVYTFPISIIQALFLCNICVVLGQFWHLEICFFPRFDKCHRRSQIYPVAFRRF